MFPPIYLWSRITFKSLKVLDFFESVSLFHFNHLGVGFISINNKTSLVFHQKNYIHSFGAIVSYDSVHVEDLILRAIFLRTCIEWSDFLQKGVH